MKNKENNLIAIYTELERLRETNKVLERAVRKLHQFRKEVYPLSTPCLEEYLIQIRQEIFDESL